VVVVEGYMDVVALAQFGVGYAVATLGTATTPWHVQKLLRQTDEVVFCFDGDSAGRRAAWRALENSLEQLQDGKQVRFLFLPPEHDPDSFVRAQGREALERLLAEAIPLSAFALKELSGAADMTTAEGRAKFLQDARPLVKKVSAPMLADVKRWPSWRITQAELEQRSSCCSRRGAEAPPRTRAARDLRQALEWVLAEPAAGRARPQISSWPTPPAPRRGPGRPRRAAPTLSSALSVPGAMELLRQGGHEAILLGLLPAVQDLQRLGLEELRLEVQGLVHALAMQAETAEARRDLDGVQSPRELTDEARALVTRALGRGKVVQND
jgi:DNA primase